MKSYLFFTAIVVANFLLQSVNVYAQPKKIEGTAIEYNMPNDKWTLKVSNSNGVASIYAFGREALPGDDSKPSISFMVEKLTEKIYDNDYFMSKIRLVNIKPSNFFDFKDKVNLAGIYGHLCKGYLQNKDSVYFGCTVNGLKAITFICEAPAKSFYKYNEEFASFLASVKYASSTNGKSDAKTDASKPKTTETEKGDIDFCSYFPLVNGMQYTYKRNNMTGQHTITETYNAVKEKVLKSGKSIKGFKISSNEANRNNTIIYYYCDSGSVNMYAEMPEYNTHIKGYKEDHSIFPSDYNMPDYKKTPIWETEKYGSGIYLSFTELKKGKVESHWTDVQIVNGNPVTITSTIEETSLTMTVGGKTYSPVIHIERTVHIKFQGEMKELNTQDLYYAKGIGKIKAVEEGEDILMGSYTTTQELVSCNLPKQ